MAALHSRQDDKPALAAAPAPCAPATTWPRLHQPASRRHQPSCAAVVRACMRCAQHGTIARRAVQGRAVPAPSLLPPRTHRGTHRGTHARAHARTHPPTCSKTATPLPMLPPGTTPKPPHRPATMLLTRLPYRLGVTCGQGVWWVLGALLKTAAFTRTHLAHGHTATPAQHGGEGRRPSSSGRTGAGCIRCRHGRALDGTGYSTARCWSAGLRSLQ